MMSKHPFDLQNRMITKNKNKKDFSTLIASVLNREKLMNEIKEILINPKSKI